MADNAAELATAIDRIHKRLQGMAVREPNYNLRALALEIMRVIEIWRGDETKSPLPPPQHHP